MRFGTFAKSRRSSRKGWGGKRPLQGPPSALLHPNGALEIRRRTCSQGYQNCPLPVACPRHPQSIVRQPGGRPLVCALRRAPARGLGRRIYAARSSDGHLGPAEACFLGPPSRRFRGDSSPPRAPATPSYRPALAGSALGFCL